VDSGNVFLSPGLLPQLKARTALDAMGAMGYTALNCGHADFVFGDSFLLDTAGESGVPLLSANLVDNATDAALAQGHMLIPCGAFTVGITGIVSRESQKIIEKLTSTGERSVKILDEVEILQGKVSELKDRTDILIVLADTGIEKARRLAKDIQGIDIIVCSGGYDKTDSPLVVNGVYIVKAGTSGEGIGNLTLSLDDDGNIQNAQGGIITLSEDVPEDDTVAAIIDSYHKSLKDYAEELIVVEQKTPEQGWYYTGAVVCAQCHVRQSGHWRGTGHPRAFTTLVDRSQDYNPECIKCHITGYGYAGGFELPDTTPERGGVQCEMCHGPGGEHVETLTTPYGETSRDVCITCHTQDHSPDFDYDTYNEKVMH